MAKKAKTPPKKAKTPKWTVMLYMATSKDEQTEQAAIRDIRELEKVGSTKHLNILVQIDRQWPGYAERYYVEKDFSRLCPDKEAEQMTDSGKREVLSAFVKWGRTAYPADYFLLVLWGHSYGLGFGRDHDDPLTLREIRDALKEVDAPIAKGRKAVDILGANACAMSYAECAYELQDAAAFLLAPEIAMPFAGWPYDKILADIVYKPTIKPIELGKRIIERFMASFEEAFDPRSVSLTLLDLAHVKEIREHLTELTTALRAALKPGRNLDKLRGQIADAFLDTAHGDVRPLIDLSDLCERLAALDASQLSDDDRAAAAAVKDRAVAAAVKKAATALSSFLKLGGELVVNHRASDALEGIHGLGIFAPAVSGAPRLRQVRRVDPSIEEYENLGLVKDTEWNELAVTQLNQLLDPINSSVAEFVDATGATNREDRLGVAQLLVSVHRSFMRLEKTLTDSQQQMMGLLNGGTVFQRQGKQVKSSLRGDVTFGPPFLRLAADDGEAAYPRRRPTRTGAAVRTVNDGKETSSLLHAVAPLAKLEDALANVERTVRRVMTHSNLGLGELKPDLGELKPDLGELKPDLGELKPDLGELKPDLGELKPDLGLFSSTASAVYATSDGTRGVTEVYRQVAWSLQLLESGVAKIESDIRAALRASTSPKNSDFSQRTSEQLQQSFRALHELVSNAKATAGSVLSDAEFGLGPTPQRALRAPGRQHLAIAGGLSSQFLRLL